MISDKTIDVETDAEYDGVVYDRYLFVEFHSGLTVKLFDNIVTDVSEDDVGSVVELELVAHTDSVSKIDEASHGIDAEDGTEVTYTGRIQEVNIEDRWHTVRGYDDLYCLDVGEGTMFINPHNEFKEMMTNGDISVGETVSLGTYRTDVLSVTI